MNIITDKIHEIENLQEMINIESVEIDQETSSDSPDINNVEEIEQIDEETQKKLETRLQEAKIIKKMLEIISQQMKNGRKFKPFDQRNLTVPKKRRLLRHQNFQFKYPTRALYSS